MSDLYLAGQSVVLPSPSLELLRSYSDSLGKADLVVGPRDAFDSKLRTVSETEVKRAFAVYVAASHLGLASDSRNGLDRVTSRFSKEVALGTNAQREAASELARVIWLRSISLSDAEVGSIIEHARDLGIHESVVQDLLYWAQDRNRPSE